MPTPRLTQIAELAASGDKDALDDFVLEAPSSYLEQFDTPEGAAEAYLKFPLPQPPAPGAPPDPPFPPFPPDPPPPPPPLSARPSAEEELRRAVRWRPGHPLPPPAESPLPMNKLIQAGALDFAEVQIPSIRKKNPGYADVLQKRIDDARSMQTRDRNQRAGGGMTTEK